MGIHYGKKYFKKLVIFRPHNVYGPDEGGEHVIPDFISKFKLLKKKKKKKKFEIQGSGNEIRSFIYIEDFLSAFNLILDRGKHLNIYNIGTSEKIRIKDLAYKMAKIYNNVDLTNEDGMLQADKVTYNFKTKYYKISMFNNEKVKIKLIE